MIAVSIGSAVLLMSVLPLIVGYGAYVCGRFTSQRKYLAEIEEQHQTICRLRLLNRMCAPEDEKQAK